MKLSAIVITRNEQNTIAECVRHLSFADEVLVVDNNSSDATVTVAEKAGARVVSYKGLDFSYLRNIGKEKAKGDWVLYVDADERIPKELAKEIERIVKMKGKHVAYRLLRKNYYLGTPWPGHESLVRLMDKNALVGWQGSLHETAMVSGSVGELSIPFLHFTHRDLTSMVAKTNEWSDVEAMLRYKAGHPYMTWWRFFRVMVSAFWKYYVEAQGWRAGTTGIIESVYQAFSMFITYAKLWELQNKSEISQKPWDQSES